MRFHLISFRSSLGLLSHRPSRAPRWRDRQGHPPIDLRRQFQVRPGYHNPRARQDRAFRPHGRRKYHVGDPRPSDCETAKDDVWTEHGRAVQACDPARRSAPSHGCRRSMRQTSDGPECGLRKSPFLMSRDRDAIRSASSLQGTCQFPDKARCRKTRFHHNVDDRQRLLHRPCRLRMTAARLASEIRAGARCHVLYRGMHPVHVQGRAAPQGNLPECQGKNRSRCRRGLEERSKSRSEDSGPRQTSTSSSGLVLLLLRVIRQ